MTTATAVKKAILFTNWTQEDFVGVYDGVSYPFKGGESIMLEEHLARKFALDLAKWSFNSKNIRYTPDKLKIAYNKGLNESVSMEAENESKLGMQIRKGVSEVNKGTSKEDLMELLDAKGIEYKGTWGVKRMQQALEESKEEAKDEEFEGLNE